MKTTRFQTLNPTSIDAEKSTIFGVSVITKGIAKGHDLIVDDTTLAQVVKCGNGAKNGIKVKVGHDSGVEEIVGRLTNFRVEEDKVLADLELLSSSPRRDFIFELAQKTPEAVGFPSHSRANQKRQMVSRWHVAHASARWTWWMNQQQIQTGCLKSQLMNPRKLRLQ